VDELLDLVDGALQPLLDQHGGGHPLRLRGASTAVRRSVREAASARAPHSPAQLPPRPLGTEAPRPPCARRPPKARALVASMPSSAPSCSKEMFVYSLEAASMLCSMTARSSTCGARGCRLGLQAGVAGWGCRLGLQAGRAGVQAGVAGWGCRLGLQAGRAGVQAGARGGGPPWSRR
jgi:hypothetical protein